MFDPRASLKSVMDDPRLDQLLTDARVQTQKLAKPDTSPVHTVSELEKQAQVVQECAWQTRQKIAQELKEREDLRYFKVSMAIHIAKVASRLAS